MQANKFNDEKIENAVALILQYGVILAAVATKIIRPNSIMAIGLPEIRL